MTVLSPSEWCEYIKWDGNNTQEVIEFTSHMQVVKTTRGYTLALWDSREQNFRMEELETPKIMFPGDYVIRFKEPFSLAVVSEDDFDRLHIVNSVIDI